ncbi:MAG TPA: UDP-N-acetylglucosamine 2-epimerase (non-hydrolyzing) [Clostridia bacterium]|nr:UDP-N-acetylglucosamine 2-epimerase (non-hydrolyzing) [Clostridia bacterium]
MLKVITVFGTRPEAIKMAPLVRKLRETPQVRCIVAVSAQHREMLDGVLELFGIIPDYDLDIMREGQTLSQITWRVLEGLGEVFRREQPDLVLVHGDTTTTFAAALAAYYEQIPVGHVEAGLRTGNKYAPFPEELNRRLTAAIADWHFAPTEQAKQNLLRENVDPETIFVTGNTVIDALLEAVAETGDLVEEPELRKIDFDKKVILLTAHRRENWGEPMRDIFCALKRIVAEHPDVELVFPVHKNPKVRTLAQEVLEGEPRIHLIEPLDYEQFVYLMNRCHLVLTDSGGLQEEAPALGKPVLVLRELTERPEAVAAGTVRVVGTREDDVYRHTKALLTDEGLYRQMAEAVNPYGDGQASRRIVDALLFVFGESREKPEPFIPGQLAKFVK